VKESVGNCFTITSLLDVLWRKNERLYFEQVLRKKTIAANHNLRISKALQKPSAGQLRSTVLGFYNYGIKETI